MIIFVKSDAEVLITKGEQNFHLIIKPDTFGKYQLFLMGCTFKKVELFKTGPVDSRNLGLLIAYSGLINFAVGNNYRVFIYKEGGIFTKGDWYLEFVLSDKKD